MPEYAHAMIDPKRLSDVGEGLFRATEAALDRYDLPAVVLAIGDERGRLLDYAGSGSVVAGTDTPPSSRTAWRVASITKSVTATALFQLRDRGLLDLDDPLARHIPEFGSLVPYAGLPDGVTLRRMLVHFSGLPTEPPLPSWSALAFPPMAEIVAAAGRTDVAVEPGRQFKYSNLAYGLLGEVVARRSGMAYVDYVRANVFEPLGMADSGFERDERPAGSPLADAWVVSRPIGGPHRRSPYASLNGLTPAGQLITTAVDLARWAAAQFADGPGPRVLAPTTLTEMQAPTAFRVSDTNSRVLGWELTTDLGGPVHGHGGGIHGFGSYLAFHAPSRVSVIVLSNLWPSRGAAAQLAAETMGRLLGGSRPVSEVASRPAASEIPMPPAATPFLGTWFAEPGFPVEIAWRAGGLWILPGDTGEYALHAPSPLTVEGPAEVRVLEGRGAGELLRFAGGDPGAWASFEIGGFVYERD